MTTDEPTTLAPAKGDAPETVEELLRTCITLSFSSCSSAFFMDCATLLACRLCLMSVEVMCCVGLAAIGKAEVEPEDLVEGDSERSIRLVSVPIRRGGGGGAGN
jgi:hypothetical protein